MEKLDLRGRECPEPYIIVMRKFMNMKPGDSMEVLMDSWKCAFLVVESMKAVKMGSVNIEKEDNYYVIKLTRLK